MAEAERNKHPETAAKSGQPTKHVVLYTVGITGLATFTFFLLLGTIPTLSASSEMENGADQKTYIFIMTLAIMFVAGALGGCLYGFRGLIKHSAGNDFLDSYNLSYYLRPFAGGVSGLIAFFLLIGGALTLSNPGTGTATAAWYTDLGRMPYIAVCLLAGFGSHEFMLKMKDLTESLFALSKR